MAEGKRRRRPVNRKHRCARESCVRRKHRDGDYCTFVCKDLDLEATRLLALYQTAGDVTLDKTAYLTLVELSDLWTEYQHAHWALTRDVYARGLPMPVSPQRTA